MNNLSPNYVDAIRYQYHVCGIGARSYDSDGLFIPSMNLQISQEDFGTRLSEMDPSIGSSKEKVQVSFDLANEVKALVEEKTALEEKIEALQAKINSLSKQFFAQN